MEYRRPSADDFTKIVDLQNRNLLSVLGETEQADGYLSAAFSEQQFREMNNDLCVVVCADREKIAGYACATSIEYNKGVPLVANMLKQFQHVSYKGKPLNAYRSFIYGPVCIDKEYRGKGILNNLFDKMKWLILHEHPELELLTVLIAKENIRSIKAHEKLDMETVGEFQFNNRTFLILVLPMQTDT
jgi:L-amino acid N-acyltransferase YncA